MTLKLDLFGRPLCYLDGKKLAEYKFKKPFALLCYLIIEHKPILRLKLASIFWPDHSEKNGLMNLRKALAILRKQVGGYIDSNYHEAWFNSSLPYQLDLIDLSMLKSISSDFEVDQFIALHRGDFLEGFYLRNAEPFETWVVNQAELFRKAYQHKLIEAAQQFSSKRNYRQAIKFAQKSLEIDPLQESTHQNLMRCYAQTGEWQKSIQQYKAFKTILHQQLNLKPNKETQQLFQAITENKIIEQKHHSLGPNLSTLPKFSGREGELCQLDHVLKKSLNQAGQIAFIKGEAGQGKSRLLYEFSLQAHAKYPDLLILFGDNDSLSANSDSYHPFREILHQLTGHADQSLSVMPITEQFTSRLKPRVPQNIQHVMQQGHFLLHTFLDKSAILNNPNFENSLSAQNHQALIKLFNNPPSTPLQSDQIYLQYARVLQVISHQTPLLIIIDNLQWADSASIQLLFYLCRRLHHASITILGAYRPDEIEHPEPESLHSLSIVLPELKSLFGEVIIDLNQANRNEFINQYLDQWPNQLSDQFREKLLKHTDGNPLFTIELIASLKKHHEIIESKEKGFIDLKNIQWNRIPAKVEGIIAQKMLRLKTKQQEILEIACVQGKLFSAEVIGHVTGKTPAWVVKKLNEPLLKAQQIIDFVGTAENDTQLQSAYQFRHDLIQEYLYNTLNKAQRYYLHQQIAEALEHQFANSLQKVSHELAFHFEQCQQWTGAIKYLQLTIDRELKKHAYQEVKAVSQKALTLLAHLPSNDETDQIELNLNSVKGLAHVLTEGYVSAEGYKAYEKIYKISQKLENNIFQFPAISGLWLYNLCVGDQNKAFTIASRMLSAAEKQSNAFWLMQSHFALGLNHLFEGEFLDAQSLLSKSLPTSNFIAFFQQDYVAEHDLSILSPYYLALAKGYLGEFEYAMELIHTNESIERLTNNPYSQAFSKTLTMLLYVSVNLPKSILEMSTSELKITGENQFAQLHHMNLCLSGWAQGMQEQIKAGIAQIIEGIELGKALGFKVGISCFYCNLAELYLKDNQIQQGLEALNQAEEALNFAGRFWEAKVYHLRGIAYSLLGRDENEVKAYYDQAISTANQQKARFFELAITISLADLLVKEGKYKEAHNRLSVCCNFFSQEFEHPDIILAKKLLTEIELKFY